MSQVWGVIPARYSSTRFPGKPLAKIKGKEMILWVIDGVKKAKLVDQIFVATDDIRIHEVVQNYGVTSIMTETNLSSGSDRIWQATLKLEEKMKERAHLIINIQGDEPLIEGLMIDQLVSPMLKDENLEMATLAHSISKDELVSENCVKVIVNQKSDAIYFSRFPIPFSRSSFSENSEAVLKHIGLYVYQRNFLKKYCETMPVEIEEAESLEQLRALFLGARIKVIKTDNKSWGVDTPADVLVVEEELRRRNGQ